MRGASIGFVMTFLLLTGAATLHAQGLADALRLSTGELPSGSRSAGLDGSTLGTEGGYDALQWNPAAIAPNETSEMGVGIYYRDHQSAADFFGSNKSDNLTTMSLSSLGLLSVRPTRRGHLVFGLSFDQVRDYTSTYSFSAVNTNSSFLNTRGFINDPGLGTSSTGNRSYLDQTNLAWQLHLTYNVPDSGTASLTTPFRAGMLQSGTVTQEGGMHALRAGAAIDVAEGISIGAALNYYYGNYSYERLLTEKDVAGQFHAGDTAPLSFQQATIRDTRTQDQEGVSLKLGLLAYQNEVIKFGVTIETPSIFYVTDNFHRSGTATFSEATYQSTPDVEPDITDHYNVTTPMKIGAGASVHLLGATFLGSATYQDYSQTRFSNGDVDLSSLNDDARQTLRSVLAWNIGVEYVVPAVGLGLRAGYGIEPAPYKNDPKSYDQKQLSFGASILLSKSLLLEGSYRHITYTTDHQLYSDVTVQGIAAGAFVTNDQVKRDEVTLGFGYRF